MENNSNNSMFLQQNKLFIDVSSKLSEIISPLNKFHINFYCYGKLYNNGNLFYVCSSLKWLKRKIEYNLFDCHQNAIAILKHPGKYKKNYCIELINGKPDPNIPIQQHMFDIGIWNEIMVYKKHHRFIELYCFCSNIDATAITNFYINNIDFIEHFSASIKDQLKNEFDVFEKDKIFFEAQQKNASSCKDANFLKSIDILNTNPEAKYTIYLLNDKRLSISCRELQCLALLSKGFTAKIIAKKLEISHRTAEKYIENLRFKTGCSCKNSLLDIYHYNFCTNIAI